MDPDVKKSDMSKSKETLEIQRESQITKEIKGIDSKIITNQHVELISKWIDGIDTNDELKTLYKFKLLHRGCDGFTSKKFREICNNQTRTVTVVRVKDSNEILGGYNPIAWERSDYFNPRFGDTKESFIFSFKNKENIENHILSRVKYNQSCKF